MTTREESRWYSAEAIVWPNKQSRNTTNCGTSCEDEDDKLVKISAKMVDDFILDPLNSSEQKLVQDMKQNLQFMQPQDY